MYKTAEKVLALAHQGRVCNSWRVHEDKVVFAYGNFDALDLDALHFLERARAQGHRLIVGVIDGSTGIAELLAALYIVDGVVLLQAREVSLALDTLKPEVALNRAETAVERPA